MSTSSAEDGVSRVFRKRIGTAMVSEPLLALHGLSKDRAFSKRTCPSSSPVGATAGPELAETVSVARRIAPKPIRATRLTPLAISIEPTYLERRRRGYRRSYQEDLGCWHRSRTPRSDRRGRSRGRGSRR